MIALPDRHPDATRLYLVRHAATTLEPGRCCGSLDVGLSAEGRAQARRMAQALGAAGLAAVYTSALARARQTAVELAHPHALEALERPGLAEIDFGELEGRSFEEVAATHPDVYATWMSRPTEVEFPAGERFPDFARRVRDTARELREAHTGDAIAIVSHGGPIRVIIAAALAMPSRALFRLDLAPAGLSAIDWIDERPLVRLLNVVVPRDRGDRDASAKPGCAAVEARPHRAR